MIYSKTRAAERIFLEFSYVVLALWGYGTDLLLIDIMVLAQVSYIPISRTDLSF